LKKYEISSDKLDEFIEDLPSEAELIDVLEEDDKIKEEIENQLAEDIKDAPVIDTMKLPVPKEEPKTTIGLYKKLISEQTGISKDDLMVMADEKIKSLKGLISLEGALFLLGKELGIDLRSKEDINEEKEAENTFKKTLDNINVNKPEKIDPFEITGNNMIKTADWKDFLKSLPKDDGGIKKTESLILKDNITFFLKMNTKVEPYHHFESAATNKYHKDYHSWKFVVKLVKISDEDSYNDIYDYGDNKDKKIYEDGKEYALWLTHDTEKFSPLDAFHKFWTDTLGLSDFDERVFAVKKFKKRSKAGRQYSVFKFFEVAD